jgi:chromosome segregation ATPase
VDERKKSIRELEAARRETLEKLTQLRLSWGEAVLSRPDTGGLEPFAAELEHYRGFLETIALFRERIRALEEGALRLQEREQALAEKGKTAAEKTGALKALYMRLGELALHNDTALDFEETLKAQAEELAARIGAQREKLGDLEGGKNAGFFSWIGSNARGALLRSGVSKNQAGLNRIYGAAGEQCFAALERRGEGQGEDPAGDLPEQIRALRQELAFLDESAGSLREEQRALRESLGIEGNSRNFRAAKQIREAEQRIEREQEQLSAFCAAFGARLCALSADTEAGAGESAWLQEEDKTVLAGAREMEEQIAGHEAGIAKLKASLRIDEKRSAIDKMKRSLLSHRQRIAASESAIAGLEKQIEEASRQIAELMKL